MQPVQRRGYEDQNQANVMDPKPAEGNGVQTALWNSTLKTAASCTDDRDTILSIESCSLQNLSGG